ncbi:chromosome partitioning protein [Cetobacterium ceti]|uniref:Chromosome partitioning protein n=1 Tax=Cetobacterium ceti TaxID=180163 RepID=A0A1T4PVZ2_9FUSO|nr:ParA family protein [Cetobacterium ceti]SJZ95734.1 chromosome partitioning protein [Cetobacterium ceti]
MGKVITIKNNKGGVGKSWITLQLAHLATICDENQNDILIITSDSQNNILSYAGIEEDFNSGLDSWIKKGDGELIRLRQNLYYIPLTNYKISNSIGLKELIKTLKNKYKYIFIDATPTLNLDKNFIEMSDSILIPTFLDQVTTKSISNFIAETELEKLRVIMPNRFTRTKKEKDYYKSLEDIFKSSNITLTLPISQSGEIGKLIDRGKTIWESNNKKLKSIMIPFIDAWEALQ